MIDEETGIDFPFYQSDVEGMFGDPRSRDFQSSYLRICDLTQYAKELSHIKDYEGNPWGHKIYCNWVMIAPLTRAFELIVSRGLTGELRTFDGCFNIRQSKGGGIMSMHSWGLAADFNAGTNAYGHTPTISHGIVKCFAECGFEWGGLWSTPDGMHFQLVWVKDRTGELAPTPWKSKGGRDVQLPESGDSGTDDRQAIVGEVLSGVGGGGADTPAPDTGESEADPGGGNMESPVGDPSSPDIGTIGGVFQEVSRGIERIGGWFRRKKQG